VTLTVNATCAGGMSDSDSCSLTVRPIAICRIEIAQFRAPAHVQAGRTRPLVVVVLNTGTVPTEVDVLVERIAPSPGPVGSQTTLLLAPGRRVRLQFDYTFGPGDAPIATFRATAAPRTAGGTGDTAEDSSRVVVR
jgi:hypothetical protein